jgi:hypothetical protein
MEIIDSTIIETLSGENDPTKYFDYNDVMVSGMILGDQHLDNGGLAKVFFKNSPSTLSTVLTIAFEIGKLSGIDLVPGDTWFQFNRNGFNGAIRNYSINGQPYSNLQLIDQDKYSLPGNGLVNPDKSIISIKQKGTYFPIATKTVVGIDKDEVSIFNAQLNKDADYRLIKTDSIESKSALWRNIKHSGNVDVLILDKMNKPYLATDSGFFDISKVDGKLDPKMLNQSDDVLKTIGTVNDNKGVRLISGEDSQLRVQFFNLKTGAVEGFTGGFGGGENTKALRLNVVDVAEVPGEQLVLVEYRANTDKDNISLLVVRTVNGKPVSYGLVEEFGRAFTPFDETLPIVLQNNPLTIDRHVIYGSDRSKYIEPAVVKEETGEFLGIFK